MDAKVLSRLIANEEKNDDSSNTDTILKDNLNQQYKSHTSDVDGIVRNKTCASSMRHNTGMIDNIKMKQPLRATIKVGIENVLSTGGNLHTGVLDTQATDGVYKVEIFEGRDLVPDRISTICFCFRISTETPNKPVFLSSSLDDRNDTNVYLKVGEYDNIKTHIDERCFIESALGGRRVLRSLIHRDHFLSYNNTTHTFVMKRIPMKQYRAYTDGLNSDNHADRQTDEYLSAVASLSECWFDFSQIVNKKRSLGQ